MKCQFVMIHKNQGKTIDGVPMILLKHTNPEGVIQLKTKTKIGPVDEVVAQLPRDEFSSRVDNWRSFLSADNEGNPRHVAIFKTDSDDIIMVTMKVSSKDDLKWDNSPAELEDEFWLPIYWREHV
jgi:hypothetical protein